MTSLAFYDLDGTLVSGNIVQRYAYFARNCPSRPEALLRFARVLAGVPLYLALDWYSRRLFNEVFFREYRGMREGWLRSTAEALFEDVVRRTIYPGARALVNSDRNAGFHTVLLTGEVDVALGPVIRDFGFDEVISNRLMFRDGAATGEVVPPILAEQEKAAVIGRLCRNRGADPREAKAYSDSFSDIPMLESVGHPRVANPDRRLRRVALARGWPICDLRGRGRRQTNT
jgi:HAD superfamily hydrolase (TIGR01490 family)